MEKYVRLMLVYLCMIGSVLLVQEAQGFDFRLVEEQVRVVDVPESAVGEVWAVAHTESWQETKNTIWTHCRDVVLSYGLSRSNIEVCQNDVARINNTSLDVLKQLKIDEQVTLPLTKTQAVEYRTANIPENGADAVATSSEAAVPQNDDEGGVSLGEEEVSPVGLNIDQDLLPGKADETIQDLRDQVALLEAEVGAVYAEFRNQGRKENERFNLVMSRLESLVENVSRMELSSKGSAIVPLVTAGIVGGSEVGQIFSDADQIWPLLIHTSWGPFFALGVALLLLLIVVLIFWQRSNIRRARNEVRLKDIELNRYHIEFKKDDELLRRLGNDIVRLEKELDEATLDFGEQMFEFDGKKYPIRLKVVTEAGKFFTTPIAESVFEKNLKTHFAHAVKGEQKTAA